MANTKKKANLGNITSRSMRRLTSGILKDYGLQMLIVLVCVMRRLLRMPTACCSFRN